MTEVVAALIWREGRFLACQRPAHKARGLLWEFAGGKVEPGETRRQALVRECREELGITVDVMGTLLPDGNVGARIDSVSPDGAGNRAGLRADDVIVKAGGEAVRGSGDVLRVRKNYRVGEEMPMTVWRDGEYLDVVLELREAAG